MSKTVKRVLQKVTCPRILQDKAALVLHDDKSRLRQATTGCLTEIC